MQDVFGDEFVKLRDGSCLRRPLELVKRFEGDVDVGVGVTYARHCDFNDSPGNFDRAKVLVERSLADVVAVVRQYDHDVLISEPRYRVIEIPGWIAPLAAAVTRAVFGDEA